MSELILMIYKCRFAQGVAFWGLQRLHLH